MTEQSQTTELVLSKTEWTTELIDNRHTNYYLLLESDHVLQIKYWWTTIWDFYLYKNSLVLPANKIAYCQMGAGSDKYAKKIGLAWAEQVLKGEAPAYPPNVIID